MAKTEMKPVICKDCLSVGTPVQVSLKNPEVNGIARAAMYRYGFVGGFIHGYTSRKNRPFGCSSCGGTNIIPVDTPQ